MTIPAPFGSSDEQNVGCPVQVPTLQRWDNQVPMPCDHYVTKAAGGYLGLHAHDCGADCFWVYVVDETAVAFRCHNHKHSLP